MVKVAVVRCEDYDDSDNAVAKALDLIGRGNLTGILTPGESIFLKTNALSARPPEAAITTHPAIIRAVARLVKDAGGKPLVGDSSGGMRSTGVALEKSGIAEVAKELDMPLENLDDRPVKTTITDARVFKRFNMGAALLEADAVISVAKLKTHLLTRYTGAVKNLYGAVTGADKRYGHVLAPSPGRFAEGILDLYAFIGPRLAIMDGVVGMEGLGPSGGKPRKAGVVLASEDCLAMDWVACQIIGYRPEECYIFDAARRRGLMPVGEDGEPDIEVVGESIQDVKVDFKRPLSAWNFLGKLPEWMLKGLFRIAKSVTLPRVNEERCRKCRVCQENCPTGAITIRGKGEHSSVDRRKCIRCYCCHELCPYEAMEIRTLGFKRK